jgi:hypothetical protein
MFCIECHTAFSWNKGTIETGVIHNPHYYEFQRRNNNGIAPRNPGDVPCGGLPDYYLFGIIIRNVCPNSQNTKLTNIHQTIAHIQHVEIRRYTPNNDQELVNRDLRVMYLLNRLGEDVFKTLLQQYEKNRQKLTDYRNICQMFCDVGSDIFRQIVDRYLNVIKQANVRTTIIDADQRKELVFYINEQMKILDGLVEYFNDNIKKVGKIYKCVYPGINENCKWVSNYETYLKKK